MKQIRPLLLLVILGWSSASAALSSVPHAYQPVLFAQIAATALAFIAPRSLDPIPVRQLALWGLQGMASLDPRLTIEHRKGPADTKVGSLVLLIASTNGTPRELFAHPAPADDDAISWGSETASLTQVAWDISDPLRRAGQARMVSAYFDEIFTHFDSYSRYVPPAEAAADRTRRNGRGGVGLTVETRAGAFVIASVQMGGPAAEAGVVVGERILAVDQQTIQGADQQALTALLAGPEGTSVTLTLRGRDGKPRPVTMERALLPPETVSAHYQDGMLVIRVTSFRKLFWMSLAPTMFIPPPREARLEPCDISATPGTVRPSERKLRPLSGRSTICFSMTTWRTELSEVSTSETLASTVTVSLTLVIWSWKSTRLTWLTRSAIPVLRDLAKPEASMEIS